MAEQFSNRAQTTLNGGISNVTETIIVTSASAFPASGNFRILIDSEIILVTSVAGNTFTCTGGRGAESTTAAAHSNGATVTHVLTAGALDTGIDDRVEDHRDTGIHEQIPIHFHSANDNFEGGIFKQIVSQLYFPENDFSLAADQNNWTPTTLISKTLLNVTATVPINITGMAGDNTVSTLKIFRNVGTNAITLKHNSGLSSLGNRFYLPGDQDRVVGPAETVIIWWVEDANGGSGGWYVHGIPPASAAPSDVAAAGSVGTSNRWARADHTHAHEAAHVGHDTLWASRGDLIVATGNDVAARHPIGTHGQVLKVDTNETGSVAWGTVAAVETQTAISGIQNSETTYISGTVKLSELANITIRSTTGQAFQFSVAAPGGTALSAGVSTGGNTEGNTTVNTGSRLVLVGSNMVSLSQATGAGASTITIKATQTNQSAIKGFGVSNTGNTAGNTGLSTGIDWVVAASGNLTASESTAVGGPNTVWLSVAPGGGAETQTAISGIANSETTYTSGTVAFSALGNLTVRSTTGQAFQISAPSQTALTATTVSSVSNSNAVGANNSRFALEAHIHEGVRRIGISTGGNTLGTTGIFAGSNIALAGSGEITLSQSTDAASNISLTFNAPVQSVQAESFSVGVSTGGNTAGNTTVNSGTRLVFSGQSNITLSQATAAGATTIGISGPDAGAGGGVTLSKWPEVDDAYTFTSLNNSGTSGGTGGSTQWSYSIHVMPMKIYEARLNFDQVHAQASYAAATAGTGSGTEGLIFGMYTKNGASLSKVSDWYWIHQFSHNSVSAQSHTWYWSANGIPNSTTLSSGTNGDVNTRFATKIFEMVMMDESSGSLPGNQYALAWAYTRRTSSVSVQGIVSIAIRGANVSTTNSPVFGQPVGTLNSQAPAPRGFMGMLSTTTNQTGVIGSLLPNVIETSLVTANQTLTSAWRPLAVSMWSNAD